MPFRFPKRPPRDATELYEWIRELLPQLEPIILYNCEVGTDVTAIAHGLNFVPRLAAPVPHCIAIVCETKAPDAHNIYLRASNLCVVNVRVIP